jgi:hypothetical protein
MTQPGRSSPSSSFGRADLANRSVSVITTDIVHSWTCRANLASAANGLATLGSDGKVPTRTAYNIVNTVSRVNGRTGSVTGLAEDRLWFTTPTLSQLRA